MLDSNQVHSPQQFFEAANHLETTFNMAYVDSKHIAYFSTGRLPILAPGTDPSLPTFGTGQYDWKGFLSLEQHPHEVDPASDTFLNWNNKPAPEWGAASDNYSYGPVYSACSCTQASNHGMNEADDASIMNRAATQDLRAVKDWPLIDAGARGAARAEQTRPGSGQPGHDLGRSTAPACSAINRPNDPGGGGARRRSGRRSPKPSSAPSSARCSRNSSRSTRPTTRRPRRGRPSTAAGTATSTRTCARCSG